MRIDININGLDRNIEIEPSEVLCDLLRKLGYTSVRKSCDTGSCGACTVLVDGKPIASCSYLAAKANNHKITTIEGVKEEAERFNKYMIDEGVVQCGFCVPGFVLTILSMKHELNNPSIEEIKTYLVGNLCRCTGYEGHLRAIEKYLGGI
ncbi:MAG: (2Fe-2S)-binding protein [Clostridiaceae bacterium]